MNSHLSPQAVQRSWWLHDSRWYQEVARRFGHQAANTINAAAIRFVATRVGRDVARTLGRPVDPRDWEDLAAAMELCRRRMWPEHLLRIEHHRGRRAGEVWTTVRRNYALHLVRSAGSADAYQCPCLELRAGWFDGLGLSVEENTVTGCMNGGQPVCTLLARFRDQTGTRHGRRGTEPENS